MEVEKVASAHNKANQLTRVPKKWLLSRAPVKASQVGVPGLAAPVRQGAADDGPRLEVKRIHERHNFGVDRTLELVRERLGERASRQLVKTVVSECRQCAMIDPAVTFR